MKSLIIKLLGVASVIIPMSCVQNNEDTKHTDNNVDKDYYSKTLFENVCLDWNSSKKDVRSFMDKLPNDATDTHMAYIYWGEKFTANIKYKFIDDKLVASVIVTSKKNKDYIDAYVNEQYTHEADFDDKSILSNVNNNTICIEYLFGQSIVYGFTPIENDIYDRLEKISIIAGNTIGLTYNSATVVGSINGIDDISTIKAIDIIYGENPELSDDKAKIISIPFSNTFSYNIKNLERSTSYYYKFRITVDGVNIYSDVYSFTTKYISIYNIGDIYPENGEAEGVVWYIEPGGIKGKIVSIEQKYGTWQVGTQWCKNLGTGWYCPNKSELLALSQRAIVDKVNETLENNNKALLAGEYWSSTIYRSGLPGDNVYYYVFVGDAKGYPTGYSGPRSEGQGCNTLAIRQF